MSKAIKARKIKLSATEKNAILNAVSWYDETAKEVIAKRHKLSSGDLEDLTTHLGCEPAIWRISATTASPTAAT